MRTDSSPTSGSSSRRGMTLFDPLSVVAGMAVLAAILLPAVQQSREAARRSQCKNNIKQQALGLWNYHDTWLQFPPAMFTRGDTSTIDDYRGPTTDAALQAGDGGFTTTWQVSILPFVDQRPVYNQIDWNRRLVEQPDVTAAMIETYMCPSAGGPTRTIGSDAKDTPPPGAVYARSDYGLNLGGGNANPIGPAGEGSRNGPYGRVSFGDTLPQRRANRGMGMSPQSRTNLNSLALTERDIKDGTSNTILIGELRTDTRDSADSRGAWARGMGAIVSAFTRGKPSDGLAGVAPPNAPTIDRTDPANPKLSIHADCPIFAAAREGELTEQVTAAACAGFGEDAAGGVGIRSQHVGGAQVGLADGTAFYFSEAMDPLTFLAMMTSIGDEDVAF